MSNLEKPAFEVVADSANALAEIPKLTLTWGTALLAYDVYVVREYENAWPILRLFAAFGAFALLIAVVGLAATIIALKNIAATDARELFSGRLPDPAKRQFRDRLDQYAAWYRSARAVALPSLLVGFGGTAIATVILLAYVLTR